MSETDPTPREVLQEETRVTTVPPVPVTVEGPTRVQMLPAPLWNARHFTTGDTNAIQVATSNAARRRIVLHTFSKNHWIGESQQKARTETGFIVPGGAMRELWHTGEVWAIVASGAGSDGISIIEEYWSE